MYHNLSLCIWWLCAAKLEKHSKNKGVAIMPVMLPPSSKISSETELATYRATSIQKS